MNDKQKLAELKKLLDSIHGADNDADYIEVESALDDMHAILSDSVKLSRDNDCFMLGKAWLSFRIGDVDMGIHVLLPTTDGHNEQFMSLFDEFDNLICPEALEYSTVLAAWAREQGYDFDPEECM
ncbi:hypothetical protein M0R72_16700 [Candidatus Pacearchaeota archaeon]|jgi:hypothetical protein|nr:hypothetical protein [Candidatus Pacearchaeota archaeon]